MMVRRLSVIVCALLWAGSVAGQQASPPLATSQIAAETARVKPGDRIALKVWMEPAMSDTFVVASSGDVVLPKLGIVRANHHTVAALQDTLRKAYAVYLRNPALEVTVLRRIGVHGEVNRPNLYLVDLTMTLRDVIALAGGITSAGDQNKITVVRDGQRIRFAGRTGAELLTTELISGDQIAVGQRSWFERNSLAAVSTAAVVVSLMVPVLREIF